MVERSDVERFIDDYRRAFERFDVARVAGYFAFPLHVTGDAAEVTVVSIPSLEAWLPQIERIVGAYRLLGVASARPGDIRIRLVTERIAQVTVDWALDDAQDDCVYDFNASYTLADFGAGLRITAIAHNERPKMMAALARKQAADRTA